MAAANFLAFGQKVRELQVENTVWGEFVVLAQIIFIKQLQVYCSLYENKNKNKNIYLSFSCHTYIIEMRFSKHSLNLFATLVWN